MLLWVSSLTRGPVPPQYHGPLPYKISGLRLVRATPSDEQITNRSFDGPGYIFMTTEGPIARKQSAWHTVPCTYASHCCTGIRHSQYRCIDSDVDTYESESDAGQMINRTRQLLCTRPTACAWFTVTEQFPAAESVVFCSILSSYRFMASSLGLPLPLQSQNTYRFHKSFPPHSLSHIFGRILRMFKAISGHPEKNWL